jgi:uncharacterized protein
MVLPGQFLERPTLIRVNDERVLEGLWHRGKNHLIVVLPSAPWEGGGMDHTVGAELAFALTQANHATLRFNYAGVGASQGHRATHPEALLEDARAALALACENWPEQRPVLVSIGASDAVALRLAREESLRALIAVAPTLATPVDFADLSIPFHVVLPELESRSTRWNDLVESVTRVPHADRAFLRNLPMVGHAATNFLSRL